MLPTKQQKILNIISNIRDSHSQMRNIFSFGSCLNLFCILHAIFPEAEMWTNIDHVITKIDNKFYDIRGQVLNVKGYQPFTSYYSKKKLSRAFKQMYEAEFKITKMKWA